jgi:CRISPR-associated exonuclease Cas4
MTMNVTGTLIWYYYICKREVWLMSHQINSFQDNDFLEIGRLIHDESYRRDKKEIQFENMKFDLVKGKGEDLVVAEIKKSSHFDKAASMQLAFYLWRLEKKGIKASGEIRVPKERTRKTLSLTPELKTELESAVAQIETIMDLEKPQPPKKIKSCKVCSYNEFCWS